MAAAQEFGDTGNRSLIVTPSIGIANCHGEFVPTFQLFDL